jgi:hypothetical protein
MADGRKTNFFTELPADVIQHSLAENLTLQSMARLSGTSRRLYHLFNTESNHSIPWRIQLVNQLGVKPEELAWLDKLKQEGKISFSYRELYRRYYILLSRLQADRFYRDISDYNDYRIFLLASSVNHPFFLTWIPKAMFYEFHIWTIQADANVIDEDFLIKCTEEQIKNLVSMATKCRKMSFLKSLTTLRNEKRRPLLSSYDLVRISDMLNHVAIFPPNINDLLRAISFCRNDEIEKLLAIKDELGLPKLLTLDGVYAFARCGNLARVRECLALKDKNGNQKFIPLLDLEILKEAAISGNLELFRELLALQDEHGKPRFSITIGILCASLAANNLDVFDEILTMKDEKGFPLVRLDESVITSAIRYGKSDVALKLLELKDEAGNFQINVNEGQLFSALFQSKSELKPPCSLEFYRQLLAIKGKNEEPRFAPPADFDSLYQVLYYGLPSVLHEMLALKNKNGGPILVPTSRICDTAYTPPLINLHVLCSYKNVNGTSDFVPLEMADPNENVMSMVMTAYTFINDARVAISKQDFPAAEIAFNKALAHSPIVFFNEVKEMITNTHQAHDDDMLSFFERMVEKLLQVELTQIESSWTIDKLKVLQLKLQPLKAENLNSLVMVRSLSRK